jgi:hypothetical protein
MVVTNFGNAFLLALLKPRHLLVFAFGRMFFTPFLQLLVSLALVSRHGPLHHAEPVLKLIVLLDPAAPRF